VAPAKHRGFKPTCTQEALLHVFPPLLPLPSSTSALLFGVFVSPVPLFINPLAEAVSGVLELPGSGAERRLTFEYLCLASELSSEVLLSCSLSSLTLQ